jgi:putative drug exporter of the RND superfamily
MVGIPVLALWWPSRLSRPAVEPPNGQQSLADDEEHALQR